jgi:hypothetical protein
VEEWSGFRPCSFPFEYVEMGSVLIRKSTRCVLLYVSQIMKFDELKNF